VLCFDFPPRLGSGRVPDERPLRLDILRPLAVLNLSNGAVRFRYDYWKGKSLPQ